MSVLLDITLCLMGLGGISAFCYYAVREAEASRIKAQNTKIIIIKEETND